MLNDAAREVIGSGALAHLVTINADGSAQVAVVWVGLPGGAPELLHTLAQTYVGPGTPFPPMPDPPPGFVTHIAVTASAAVVPGPDSVRCGERQDGTPYDGLDGSLDDHLDDPCGQ